MTVAFLFPGQGSQHAGMGSDLLADAEIRALAVRCSEIADVDLPYLLAEATDEELMLTVNAQPALVFVGVSLAILLARRGIEPAMVAGHSVGEYTALCTAGAISLEQAVLAVVERGQAMATASPAGQSSMLAVLGIASDQVERALQGLERVWPANFNTPTQTVVGGATEALAEATVRLREAGARRVLPLNVSAAFHTPLVAEAASRLRKALDRLEWSDPKIPVMANVDANPHPDASAIPANLELQLSSPVRWAACVEHLVAAGCDSFIEVGPRRALSSMMRELAPGARVGSVATPAAVAELSTPAGEAGNPCYSSRDSSRH